MLRAARTAGPVVVLAVAVWWAGVWLAPLALLVVACWRTPDPGQVRYVAELLAAALVLVLAALALLIHCAKGTRIDDMRRVW